MREASSIRSNVETRRVVCANGMDAFLALPARQGAPAFVLLHERYGLVQHSKDLAIRFAADEYACVVPNLYFRDPDQQAIARGETRGRVTDPQVTADVDAAIQALEAAGANTAQVVVMGVCATGRYPLVVAAQRAEVSACVVFYGGADGRQWEANAEQPEPLEALIAASRTPVLGVFAEGDHVVSIDDVRRWRDALERARRSYHIRVYKDAPHGFLNDTMPGRYRPQQAESALALLRDFLERVNDGRLGPDPRALDVRERVLPRLRLHQERAAGVKSALNPPAGAPAPWGG